MMMMLIMMRRRRHDHNNDNDNNNNNTDHDDASDRIMSSSPTPKFKYRRSQAPESNKGRERPHLRQDSLPTRSLSSIARGRK